MQKIVVAVIVILLLLFSLKILYDKITAPSNMILSFGPGKCDDFGEEMRINNINSTIIMYGARKRADGADNELYSPNDAIRHFKIYLACKQKGMYSAQELESYNTTIINTAKAVYVSAAEDICTAVNRLPPRSDERKDRYDEYADLSDDFYSTFQQDISLPEDRRCSPY
jgi:hypothetical protein